MITSCFIEPLDVLFLRGNKLFGDPGSYGESLVPPWPSVAAGALRSRMLVDAGIDLAAFARGKIQHPQLGTPQAPGSFTLTGFHLARRHMDGRIERLFAPPADLVISERELIRRLHPTALASGIASSYALPLLPVLAEDQRSKPATGYWLNQAGWQAYLAGDTPTAQHLVKSSALWGIDHRVGVGLDAERRSSADGQLFTVQAVAMKQRQHDGYDVGFVASVAGSPLPQSGLLRLGGDGRGAALHRADLVPVGTDLNALATARRCRIVLTSPGLFDAGWRLPGCHDDGQFSLHGVSARLVCAAVPRAETVSGWDIARHQPKPAQRVAPSGSVYWLEDISATPDALGKLAASGLWPETGEDSARRAEGFNRFEFAAY